MNKSVFEIVAEHIARETENENSPGEILNDRYRIVKEIKRGGMGIVYEARDLEREDSDGARVAVKKMLVKSSESEESRRQFEREADLLKKLDHQALPKFIDYFTNERGYQYLVMEFVPGEDIAERLRKNRRGFPIEQVLQWADELLDVLQHLHSQSPPVVHCDIKPANLKLSEKNQIVLLDFGIAKEFSEQTNDTMTSGVARASRDYASPEQLQGKSKNQAADIFSAAATLFHLATGVPAVSADERCKRVSLGRPDPLLLDDDLIKDVPLKIAAVLHNAMSLRKEERPNAAKMREALLKARLLVSLYDALASVATNAAETSATALKNAAAMLATVRSGLKTRTTIAARSLAVKFETAKENIPEAVSSLLRFFAELGLLLISKVAPVCLLIFLLNWFQTSEKLPVFSSKNNRSSRSTPLPAREYTLAPPSSGFGNKPTTSGAEIYGINPKSENSSWTYDRSSNFRKSYNEYYEKEETINNLSFAPENYKTIKRLASEQIKLLNEFKVSNRRAARADESVLPTEAAQTNIKHIEILRRRAESLLKLDAASARTILKKREQLKIHADRFELVIPKMQIHSQSYETYRSTTNVDQPQTGLY